MATPVDELITQAGNALSRGNVAELDALVDQGLRAKHLDWHYILSAAIKGGVPSLRWVMTMGVTPARLHDYIQENDITSAATDTCKWLYQHAQPQPADITRWIVNHIKQRRLDLLQWMYSYRMSWFAPITSVWEVRDVMSALDGEQGPQILDWLLMIKYITLEQVNQSLATVTYINKTHHMLDWLADHGIIGPDSTLSCSSILRGAIKQRNMQTIMWLDKRDYLHRCDVLKYLPLVASMDMPHVFDFLVKTMGITGMTHCKGVALAALEKYDALPMLQYLHQNMGMTLEHCMQDNLLYEAIKQNQLRATKWLMDIGYPLQLDNVILEFPTSEMIYFLCDHGADKSFWSRFDCTYHTEEHLKSWRRQRREAIKAERYNRLRQWWHTLKGYF